MNNTSNTVGTIGEPVGTDIRYTRDFDRPEIGMVVWFYFKQQSLIIGTAEGIWRVPRLYKYFYLNYN